MSSGCATEVVPSNPWVVFNAARLEGKRRLVDYGIDAGAVVYLVRPKRGWLYLATRGSVLEVSGTLSSEWPLDRTVVVGASGFPVWTWNCITALVRARDGRMAART